MIITPFKNRAFTLIELLVVIALVGILSTLTVASVSQSRMRADKASASSLVESAYRAIRSFQTNYGSVIQPIGGYMITYINHTGPTMSYVSQPPVSLVSGQPDTLFTELFSGTESDTALSYGVRIDPTKLKFTQVYYSTYALGVFRPLSGGIPSCWTRSTFDWGHYCVSPTTNPADTPCAIGFQASKQLVEDPGTCTRRVMFGVRKRYEASADDAIIIERLFTTDNNEDSRDDYGTLQ